MNDQNVMLASAACWGIVLIVWLAGALYNASHAPKERIRTESTSVTLAVATFLACSILLLLGRGLVQNLVVDAAWVRFLGLVILVASTAFALWARFSLGTSWSVAPEVGGDRRLRTQGPYAVTRHPIYTGLLGMTLGTARPGDPGRRGRSDRVLGQDACRGAAPPGELSRRVPRVPTAGAATRPRSRRSASEDARVKTADARPADAQITRQGLAYRC